METTSLFLPWFVRLLSDQGHRAGQRLDSWERDVGLGAAGASVCNKTVFSERHKRVQRLQEEVRRPASGQTLQGGGVQPGRGARGGAEKAGASFGRVVSGLHLGTCKGAKISRGLCRQSEDRKSPFLLRTHFPRQSSYVY